MDGNCRQHIEPWFARAEVEELVKELRARVAELEGERDRLLLRA